MKHGPAFAHVKEHVLPEMEKHAKHERKRTGESKGPRQSHFQTWWKFWRGRGDLLRQWVPGPSCVRHTRRPVFEFISPNIRPNDALTVFALADDYSFGILQSDLHWRWFVARCSMLKGDWRYTSETVFDAFPWPQEPTRAEVKKIAAAAAELRQARRRLMTEGDLFVARTLPLAGDPGERG